MPLMRSKYGCPEELIASAREISLRNTYKLQPKEVLVVGDNPDSETEAGNRLGVKTVQILRPGVTRGNNATYYIHGLVELKDLVIQG